jgi:hypothetical protein
MAISAWIYIVLTAMKRGDEALNASSLKFFSTVNNSSLQFFLSIKHFIAITFYEKHCLTLLCRYFFQEIRCLMLHSPLLFKVTLPTSGHQRWALANFFFIL